MHVNVLQQDCFWRCRERCSYRPNSRAARNQTRDLLVKTWGPLLADEVTYDGESRRRLPLVTFALLRGQERVR